VIALRKGTVSGYSPRMRFDLIVNAMFRSAMRDGLIRVNNPAIWRPILSIEDACMAYVRSVEASESISGIFNVASGNHTVGEVADVVRDTLQKELGAKLTLDIQHVKDIRVLSFHARHDIRAIVCNLIDHMDRCNDWDNPRYYNIQTFKTLEEKTQGKAMSAMVE
jgi:nucleoside-diphosphate-sugar epimerase